MSLPYKFELQGYCEGCPYFSPIADTVEYAMLGDTFPKVSHIIRCENGMACDRVARIVNQVIE